MSNPLQYANLPQAFIEGNAYDVAELTDYHFVVKGDNHDFQQSTTYQVVLYQKSGERLSVEARVKKIKEGNQFRFSNITLKATEKLALWLKEGEDSGDALNKLSYDQIARGETGSSSQKKQVKRNKKGDEKLTLTQQIAKSAPVFVFLAMILFTVLFFGSIMFVAKKRNRIKVNNGSLVGNYIPVQSSEDGRLQNCFVNEGDYVKTGDILFSISNAQLEEEYSLAKAEVIAAEAKVSAIQKLIDSEKNKFDISVNQAKQGIEVAKAEYTKSVALVAAQQRVVETIEWLRKSRAKYDVGYQKEVSSLRALEADVILKHRLVSEKEGSLAAMIAGQFIVFGEKVDDRLNRYKADLLFASSDVVTARSKIEMVKIKSNRLNVRAPKDGRVFAVYRFNGEYVKVAESIMSISSEGRSWAFGAVEIGLAHRIRPGQPVRVQMPALNQEVEGIVASVGHRSIYTSGGWSQDFRVDIHSVPIKVWLPEMADNPPTGLRLKMDVNLPFRWPWQEPEKFDPNSIKRTASVNQENQ